MDRRAARPIFANVAVLGVGLIGGSLGLAARTRGLAGRVVGYGRSRANLEDALQIGAIDAAAASPKECVEGADAVFICTPVRTVSPLLAGISPHLSPGTIVTDVGSTKQLIAREAAAAVPAGVHFIGGHPMAGTEKSGAKYSDANLFEGAVYVLTPDSNTDPEALERLSAFVEEVGARCILMDAELHDRAVAAISHLPHIIAPALLEVVARSDEKTGKSFELAAGSFRDLTRIADSPSQIWRDICITNKDAVCEEIKNLVQSLNTFRAILEAGDEDAVQEFFERGSQIRGGWIKKRMEQGDE